MIFRKNKPPVPTSWEELTLAQSYQIEEAKSSIEMYSVITGRPVEDLLNDKSLKEEDFWAAVGFVHNPPDWTKQKKPAFIEISGKRIPLPGFLAKETLGQKVTFSQLVKEEKDMHALIPKAVAIYMQPKIDGKFIPENLKRVEAQLMQSPCVQVYAAAWFFFRKSRNLMKFGVLGLPERRMN